MALAEARPVSLAVVNGAARHSFARINEVAPIPNLIKVQRDSFDWFLREGLKELFAEISPIQDFTGRNMDLELAVPGPDGEPGYSFGQPKMTEDECREHDVTFAAPLKVRMRLKIKSGENAGEIKEQDIFMGDFPLMTDQRHLHHQRRRARRRLASWCARRACTSPPKRTRPRGRELCMGKLIPSRGAWLEFETSQPRRHVGQGRPQAQDPGHHAAAGAAAGRARVHRGRARAPTRRFWRCSRASTRAATTTSSRRRSTRTRPATPRRRCSSSTAAASG